MLITCGLLQQAFFELSKAGGRTQFTIRGVLKQLTAPMLVLHGNQDPWMKVERSEKFARLYSNATVVPIDAGHCPQDDNPDAVNSNLLRFLVCLLTPILKWPRGTGFPELPSAVISTVDHPLGSPSLLYFKTEYTGRKVCLITFIFKLNILGV
jgi:hypothetical protein